MGEIVLADIQKYPALGLTPHSPRYAPPGKIFQPRRPEGSPAGNQFPPKGTALKVLSINYIVNFFIHESSYFPLRETGVPWVLTEKFQSWGVLILQRLMPDSKKSLETGECIKKNHRRGYSRRVKFEQHKTAMMSNNIFNKTNNL